jgi:hypothetical protein
MCLIAMNTEKSSLRILESNYVYLLDKYILDLLRVAWKEDSTQKT